MEAVTTPPILSSSPGFGHDAMDISPLPHKAPYSCTAQITLQSPTPDSTPTDEDMLTTSEAAALNPLAEPRRQFLLPEYVAVEEQRRKFNYADMC